MLAATWEDDEFEPVLLKSAPMLCDSGGDTSREFYQCSDPGPASEPARGTLKLNISGSEGGLKSFISESPGPAPKPVPDRWPDKIYDS